MAPWTERIALRHVAPAAVGRLREPDGHVQLDVGGVDTRAAVQLLDRVLEGAGASELSASDRDAALAALHRALWGDRIVASLACGSCGATYDLSFDLSVLQRQLWQGAEATAVTGPRALEDASGVAWQLPAAGQEEAAAALGAEAGRAELAGQVGGNPGAGVDAIGARLEALAPLLDVDLDAACPECGRAQQARFDVQTFVMQRLRDERETVLGEVHALAGGYGWSLGEILSLRRGLRQSLVQRLGGMAAMG